MKLVTVLVAALMAVLVLGACGGGDEAAPKPTSTSQVSATPAADAIVTPTPFPIEFMAIPHDINQVSFEAGEYSFSGPKFVPPGWTEITLVNKGQELHHLQLIRLGQGKRLQDLLDALREEGPPPDWMIAAGGPSITAPGGSTTVTVNLIQGAHAMLDFLPDPEGVPHFALDMARGLTITGSTGITVPEPEATLNISMTDFDYELSAPIQAGPQILKVENQGEQDHEVAIVKMAPGATAEEVLAGFEPGAQGPTKGTPFAGLQAIRVGDTGFVNANFEAGNYLLVCFLPDVETGQPHYLLGMQKVISVQ